MKTNKLTAEQQALVLSHRNVSGEVVKRYWRFARSKSDLSDLTGCSDLALCVAAKEWNPDHGSKFSSYAFKCCLRAVQNYIRDRGLIRTPAQCWLKAGHSHTETADRARRVGMTEDAGHLAERKGYAETIDQIIDRLDVQHAITTLPGNERTVIELRMLGWKDSKIGKFLGVTGNRAWQIRMSAERRLRERFGVKAAI